MKPRLSFAFFVVLMTAVFQVRGGSSSHGGGPATDSVRVQVKVKNSIRLFPNPTYDGTISVHSNLTDKIYFYIFDLEGTLIYQKMLVNKQKVTVTDLRKGIYMYDVFRNDISIEQGKIVVK